MASSFLRRREIKSIRRWIRRVRKRRKKISKYRLARIAKRQLSLPYRMIDCGSKRIVYDLGNGLVLKVAINRKGLRDNRKEMKVYRSAPRYLKKHLARIRQYGRGWLVMDKVTRKIPPKSLKYRARLRRLKYRFKRRGIVPKDLISKKQKKLKGSNTRLNRKGRIVIIDYGNFKIK